MVPDTIFLFSTYLSGVWWFDLGLGSTFLLLDPPNKDAINAKGDLLVFFTFSAFGDVGCSFLRLSRSTLDKVSF